MSPRKKPKTTELEGNALAGRKARVSVERAGLCIVVDDVVGAEAGIVAADLLRTFRHLGQHFPELREYPDVVPSAGPLDVPDADDWEERHRPRKVGFTKG